MAEYFVKTLKLPSGERLPVLIDRSTGLPVFYPNLFILTELRQTNLATATIERALREIMVLLDFLALDKIDLADRIKRGQLLTLGEIDGLARHCKQSFKHKRRRKIFGERTTVISFDRNLSHRNLNFPKKVESLTTANRIRTIHAYISWLVNLRLTHESISEEAKASLAQARADILPTLLARIPPDKGRNTLGQRQGASSTTMQRLVKIIDPVSPDNPWCYMFTKKRNVLILHLLWKLGLRRGELLNIKITDIDFRANTIIVARRADDPEDPRTYQPRVKTRDRKLPISIELADALHHYIINDRSRILGARKNSFLFVAERTGTPLSLSALNKLFMDLRIKRPELPSDFTGHVLRHTWNDDFSKHVDEEGVSDELAEKMRNYMMGWSPNSKTAQTYTRRRVEEKARQASLDMQSKMTIPKNDI